VKFSPKENRQADAAAQSWDFQAAGSFTLCPTAVRTLSNQTGGICAPLCRKFLKQQRFPKSMSINKFPLR
jgi:hypothetical protein